MNQEAIARVGPKRHKKNIIKNGKYWAIIGPKLYEPPEDQDYRRIAVFSTMLVNGESYTFTPPYTPSWHVQGQPYLVIGTLVHVFLIEGADE
jgi:hypothetical protein